MEGEVAGIFSMLRSPYQAQPTHAQKKLPNPLIDEHEVALENEVDNLFHHRISPNNLGNFQ